MSDGATIFVTKDFEVYSCGSQDRGRLGLGETDSKEVISLPQLIQPLIGKRIKFTSSGHGFSLCLSGSFYLIRYSID